MTELHIFETNKHKTNQWLHNIAKYGGWEKPESALASLRATLQTLRDQLRTEDSAHLAAQLPTLIRGFYFEDWQPAHTPAKLRHEKDFIASVEEKLMFHEEVDPLIAIQAVMLTLCQALDPNEVNKLKNLLPKHLKTLLFIAPEEFQ